MKLCGQCKNRGKESRCEYYTKVSNYAEICKDFEEKKKTNGEHIRSMSDGELAEFILNNCDNPISENNEDICDYCEEYEDKEAECYKEGCKKAIVKWLRSESEE